MGTSWLSDQQGSIWCFTICHFDNLRPTIKLRISSSRGNALYRRWHKATSNWSWCICIKGEMSRRFVSHWYNILADLLCFTVKPLGMWNRLGTSGRFPWGVSLKFRLLHRTANRSSICKQCKYWWFWWVEKNYRGQIKPQFIFLNDRNHP